MATKAKRITAMLLAALCILSVCACGNAAEDDYVKGQTAGKDISQSVAADDVFTLNYSTKYSMNPMIATNTNNQLVCNLVYENMIEVNNNYEALPNVITEWKTSDGGVHWVFTVDTSRRFHNGEQMTAKDVAYSLNLAVNSERFAKRLNCVIGCGANDEKTFSVTLSKANMLLPNLMAVPVIKNGTYGNDYPDGTGPYKYADDHKSLVKFDKYPNAATLPLDVIYLKEYNTVDSTISAFEDSLLDIVMNDPSAPTNLGYGSSNEIRGINTTNFHYIGTNIEGSEMSYDGLRFALNYAFDRESLVEQFGGFALEAALPVSPACSFYSESYAKQFNYNTKQVQQILSNMGLKDYDEDGLLEMKVGEEVKEIDLDFIVCNASSIKTNAAKKFAEDMAKLGIKVSVRELSWSDYIAALDARNFDLYYAEVRLNPDFDLSMLFMPEGKLNYGNVNDEMLMELIGSYLAAQTNDERKEACANMCAQIINKGYIIPLCFEKHQMITHRGVIEGIKACENNPLLNVQNWKVTFGEVEKKTDENNK